MESTQVRDIFKCLRQSGQATKANCGRRIGNIDRSLGYDVNLKPRVRVYKSNLVMNLFRGEVILQEHINTDGTRVSVACNL